MKKKILLEEHEKEVGELKKKIKRYRFWYWFYFTLIWLCLIASFMNYVTIWKKGQMTYELCNLTNRVIETAEFERQVLNEKVYDGQLTASLSKLDCECFKPRLFGGCKCKDG